MEGGDNSVVDGKHVVGTCFSDGKETTCKLKEGDFRATILTSGIVDTTAF